MEQWKAVKDYEDLYEVSTKDGKVRNVNTGRILSQFKNDKGYCCVTLCRNGGQKNFLVHRLVATAFIPNPDNLPEVDHIDRDRTNNCVENLRWVSHKQNIGNSDRNEKRVLCVETGKIYDSITQASVETGCDVGNISRVCQGKRKTTGGFHWKYVE